MSKNKSPRKLAGESPTAWFAVLERARLTNNFQLAAGALRKLGRMGVIVTFLKQRFHRRQGRR